jgi:CheY-like chemotaxis protein/PAS domain-containing protein
MGDAASFDAIMQYSLLEVFCEALGAAVFVTDKLDEVSFASVRLMHHFPIRESQFAPGTRARDLYGALYDAGCRFGYSGGFKDKKREDWIAERVASAWKERVDAIEPSGPDRWFRVISRRFSSGLGFTIIQDVTEHKKKEQQWRTDHERVRMTEEILDALPVAIAVKDRNLNFAAVNRQFCRNLNTAPDAILGASVWDIFEPVLAGSLEEADWHLLATGEDRESIVKIDRPEGQSASFLHRARRIGKAGSHYIAMSFDELPLEKFAGSTSAEDPDLVLAVGGEQGIVATQGDGRNLVGEAARLEKGHKVVYVSADADEAGIVRQAAARNIELCIVRNETEFGAFLTAITEAGIRIDLVVIDPSADFTFATLAARYGIRHRMLSPGADPMESIIDAFERKSRPVPAPARPSTPAEPQTIDVLAVEDNPVNRLVVEQILENLGLDFLVVSEGRKAVEKIAEFKPQVVLVDVTLPDMEIDEFIPALKLSTKDSGAKPPVIGMISRDSAEQRQACKQAGMVDIISKPLSSEAVDRMLRKHLFNDTERSGQVAISAA